MNKSNNANVILTIIAIIMDSAVDNLFCGTYTVARYVMPNINTYLTIL